MTEGLERFLTEILESISVFIKLEAVTRRNSVLIVEIYQNLRILETEAR